MKRFVTLTAAALAFSATAAMADPYYAAEDQAYADRGGVAGQVYDTPSQTAGYVEVQPTAPGLAPQNDTQALDWTPNTGAGTSRSTSANQS